MLGVNPLLEGRQAVGEWLQALQNVAATLYETDAAAWEQFEPARKAVAEALAWLDWESEMDLASTSVSDALAVMKRKLPEESDRWHVAAEMAIRTLGTAIVDDLLPRK